MSVHYQHFRKAEYIESKNTANGVIIPQQHLVLRKKLISSQPENSKQVNFHINHLISIFGETGAVEIFKFYLLNLTLNILSSFLGYYALSRLHWLCIYYRLIVPKNMW